MALAYDGAIQRLIDAFGRLPGIGPKGAQRIAFYMLSAPEDEARDLAEAIEEAVSYTHLGYASWTHASAPSWLSPKKARPLRNTQSYSLRLQALRRCWSPS